MSTNRSSSEAYFSNNSLVIIIYLICGISISISLYSFFIENPFANSPIQSVAFEEVPTEAVSDLDNINYDVSNSDFYNYDNLIKIHNSNPNIDIKNNIKENIINYLPNYGQSINDFAKVLSDSNIDTLKNAIRYYQENFGISVMLVTVFPFMYNDLQEFSLKLANNWGNINGENNMGILFTIDIYDKKIYISNGMGIQKYYSNIETQNIIDNQILPWFNNGNTYNGIYNGIVVMSNEIITKMNGSDNQANMSKPNSQYYEAKYKTDPKGNLIFAKLYDQSENEIRNVMPGQRFNIIDSISNFYIVKFIDGESGRILKTYVDK